MTEEIIIDGGRMAGITKLKNEIIRLEQENRELKETVKSLESEIRQKKRTIMMNNDHYLTVDENNQKYRSALEEINRVVKLAHKVEDYLLGQDYTDLVDRIEKELEVLK